MMMMTLNLETRLLGGPTEPSMSHHSPHLQAELVEEAAHADPHLPECQNALPHSSTASSAPTPPGLPKSA